MKDNFINKEITEVLTRFGLSMHEQSVFLIMKSETLMLLHHLLWAE